MPGEERLGLGKEVRVLEKLQDRRRSVPGAAGAAQKPLVTTQEEEVFGVGIEVGTEEDAVLAEKFHEQRCSGTVRTGDYKRGVHDSIRQREVGPKTCG